jgi:hypothetical protein
MSTPAPKDQAPLPDREPVRLYVYAASIAAGLVTSVGTFFWHWSATDDWRAAMGLAFLAFALPTGLGIGGAEAARNKAYSPATYNRDIDAHAVIEREQSAEYVRSRSGPPDPPPRPPPGRRVG